MITIKRVDIMSAMKVGALFNALTVTVFGILFFACNSLFLSSMSASIAQINAQTGGQSGFNSSAFATATLASCLIGYVIAVVAAAFSGAVLGAMYAFFYNVISNWAGGLRVELDVTSFEALDKPKRLDTGDTEFKF